MNTCKTMKEEVLLSDGPLFSFTVIDEPIPINDDHWPGWDAYGEGVFIQFGQYIMDEIFKCFEVRDIFEYYDISNYHGMDDLVMLIKNIGEEIEKFQNISTVDQFRDRFGHSFDSYPGDTTGNEDETIFVNEHWSDIRDDLIKILGYIRDRASDCMKSGETLAIVGI